MARPRSEDKRSAILEAATRAVETNGLGAPTAGMAEAAGVANGSLFTYFKTKSDLFNQLYLELKTGMAAAIMEDLPRGAGLREQLLHIWQNWMSWATSFPGRRRVLAQLGASDQLTPDTRAAGHAAMAQIAELLERSRANGPMRGAPRGFVVAITNSVAEATMDYMAQDPANSNDHARTGFDALWRVLA